MPTGLCLKSSSSMVYVQCPLTRSIYLYTSYVSILHTNLYTGTVYVHTLTQLFDAHQNDRKQNRDINDVYVYILSLITLTWNLPSFVEVVQQSPFSSHFLCWVISCFLFLLSFYCCYLLEEHIKRTSFSINQ